MAKTQNSTYKGGKPKKTRQGASVNTKIGHSKGNLKKYRGQGGRKRIKR